MTNKQKYIELLKRKKAHDLLVHETNQEIHNILPQIYAAFGIALHRKGWKNETIASLFAATQQIWTDNCDSGVNMCELCEQLTGIDVRGE